MPMMNGSRGVAVELERDHSPLPDVGDGVVRRFFVLGVLLMCLALGRQVVLQRER